MNEYDRDQYAEEDKNYPIHFIHGEKNFYDLHSHYDLLRHTLYHRVYWSCEKNFIDNCINTKFVESLIEDRQYFKEESTYKYINMLKTLKEDIDVLINAEEENDSEFIHQKNELKRYNFTLIFAATKLIVLAKRAQKKIRYRRFLIMYTLTKHIPISEIRALIYHNIMQS